MTAPKQNKVIFYRVKDNASKLGWISAKAREAYDHEKRLLIVVPNLQAAHYVDSLLWRMPEESFIPHVVTDMPTIEWVAITLQEQSNVNQATRLLNLCSGPTPLYGQMEEIFEIFDETSADKAALSQQRLRYYQEKGVSVSRN